MSKPKRFLIGGVIILAALSYMIYGGMQEAIVYFVTPSELKATEQASGDKFLRMGGMVVKGSLKKDLQNLTYHFELTDGTASFPVFFKGVPPDLVHRRQRRRRRRPHRQRWSISGIPPSWPNMPKNIVLTPMAMLAAKSFIPAKEATAK